MILKFNNFLENNNDMLFTLEDMKRAFDIGAQACGDLDGYPIDNLIEELNKKRNSFIEDIIKFGFID